MPSMWRRSACALSSRKPIGAGSTGWFTRAIASVLVEAAGDVQALGGDVVGGVEREPDCGRRDLVAFDPVPDRDALGALGEEGVDVVAAFQPGEDHLRRAL